MSQFQSLLFNNSTSRDPGIGVSADDGIGARNNVNSSIRYLDGPHAQRPSGNNGQTDATLSEKIPAISLNHEQTNRPVLKSKHELTVSIHDAATSPENVLVDLNTIPGAKEGDYAILYKKISNIKLAQGRGSNKKRSLKERKRLIFQLKQMDSQLVKKLNNKFQISILNNSLPLYLNVNRTNQLYVRPISPELYQVDLIEIYIKDIYLSRGDMWILSNYIVNNYSYCYVQQNLTIFNSINLSISKIYIKNANVFSGIINKKTTKIIFRSKSSKLTFLIQLSHDMFHFDTTGGVIYNKIITSLFPSIFQNWLEMGTNHLITVILFTSIVNNDDEQLLNCRAGETFRNAKDYYRIVVDQVNINHWSKIMVNLRYEILKFKEDIHLIDKQMLPSVKGNLLQALNLSTVLMLNNVNNLTSLRHTQNHFILISPGSGLFDIDFNAFNKITKKLLKLDISIDLLCLGTKPLHYTPMFRYRNLNNKLVYRFPTWFNCFFWTHNKFVNSFNLTLNSSQLKDRQFLNSSIWNDDEEVTEKDIFELRCKIYELQMMGVMEFEMSGLEVPFLPKEFDEGASHKDTYKTIKEYIEEYDSKAFKSSYIDVSEEKLDEWLSSALGSNLGPESGKRLSDIKKFSKKLPSKEKDVKVGGKDKYSQLVLDEAQKAPKTGPKKPSLVSKQSLIFVPNGNKDDQTLGKFNHVIHNSNETDSRSTIKSLRSAAHSTVLIDDIAGVTNQISASAYSNLKENQKALYRPVSTNDSSSVMSKTSNDTSAKSSLKQQSFDDLLLRSKLTHTSSHSDRKQDVSQQLLQLSRQQGKTQCANHLYAQQPQEQTQGKSTKQLTFRSLSEMIFQALGNQNNLSSSILAPGIQSTGKTLRDNQSLISAQSQQKNPASLLRLPRQHQKKSLYYQKPPFLTHSALTTSSTNTLKTAGVESSKRNTNSKANSTKTRFELKNTKEKQVPLPNRLNKNPIESAISSNKLFVRSLDIRRLRIDKEQYLGILVENPMRRADLSLRFETINFGKWANIYPLANNVEDQTMPDKTIVLQHDKSSTVVGVSTKSNQTQTNADKMTSTKNKNLISWKSLICPASLPTTSNEFPGLDSLKYEYSITNYEIFPNSKFKDLINARDLFKEMIYVRLMMGFQICNASNNSLVKKFETNENGTVQRNIDLISYYLPKDFEEDKYGEDAFNPIVYLLLTDEVHRIFLDFYGNIRVRIYRKVNTDIKPAENAVAFNNAHIGGLNENNNGENSRKDLYNNDDAQSIENVKDNGYKPFVRTRYDTCYKQVKIDASSFDIANYNWNKVDYYLAGNFDEKHADFKYDENDRINVFQIRLVILKNSSKGEENNEEENNDNHSLVSKQTNSRILRHFENLKNFLKMVQKDEYKGSSPTSVEKRKIKRRTTEDDSVDADAYISDFEEYDSDSDDSDSSDDDSVSRENSRNKNSIDISNGANGANEDCSGASVHPVNSNQTSKSERMKPMLLDIDPNGKSHKPEILKIYYDDLTQYSVAGTTCSFDETCYHIKLQWLTTTPKLIDDLITRWAHTCERYCLKLVEVPSYEAYKTPKINPFHSYINIKLTFNPWDHISEYFRFERVPPMNKFYYHNFLLRASDFYLDDGNNKFLAKEDNAFPDSAHHNREDNENGSSSDQDFRYVQYIHKSGTYLAELKDNGEFFLAPNNIFIARVNLKKQAVRRKPKSDNKDLGNMVAPNRNSIGDVQFPEGSANMSYHYANQNIYKDERDYLTDYTNYQTSQVSDEDDYFFDSQSIMIKFLEKCNNPDYLKKIFNDAKEELINSKK